MEACRRVHSLGAGRRESSAIGIQRLDKLAIGIQSDFCSSRTSVIPGLVEEAQDRVCVELKELELVKCDPSLRPFCLSRDHFPKSGRFAETGGIADDFHVSGTCQQMSNHVGGVFLIRFVGQFQTTCMTLRRIRHQSPFAFCPALLAAQTGELLELKVIE